MGSHMVTFTMWRMTVLTRQPTILTGVVENGDSSGEDSESGVRLHHIPAKDMVDGDSVLT